jgi:hypothetical protein
MGQVIESRFKTVQDARDYEQVKDFVSNLKGTWTPISYYEYPYWRVADGQLVPKTN